MSALHPSLAPTPPAWAQTMLGDLDHLLVEQGHLEKKAAANAMNCLFKWPDRPELQEPLSRLAREELVHFERVLKLLGQRGGRFRAQRPSSYATRLKELVRPRDPQRLLDELLVGAAIEARSSERMQRMAEALERVPAARGAEEVARFYRDLVAAEARHKEVYYDLAVALCGADAVAERWRDVQAHEALVMARPSARPGLHAGWGALAASAAADPGER